MVNFDFKNVEVCIYHKNCCDGFCCAFIIHRQNPGAEFLPMNPSSEIDDDLRAQIRGKKVLIVDLSFKKEDLLEMRELCDDILVIDHHKTAYDDLKDLSFAIFDMQECGASLLSKFVDLNQWEYAIWRLVKYVKDRDLWLWKENNSREINSLIQLLPQEWDAWDKFTQRLTFEAPQLVKEGANILKLKDHLCDVLAKNSTLVELYTSPERIEKVKARVVNCPMAELISDTGHRILELESERSEEQVAIACLYTLFPDGMRLFSLRSVSSFDASVIAKAWGGGGHPAACGFKIKPKDVPNLPWVVCDQPLKA